MCKNSLRKTKNDPLGTAPLTNRTHLIPCVCPTNLDGKHKATLIILYSADQTGMNSSRVCARCSYQYPVDYINVIPETAGNHKLLRILINGSNLTSPYGESSLREIPKL